VPAAMIGNDRMPGVQTSNKNGRVAMQKKWRGWRAGMAGGEMGAGALAAKRRYACVPSSGYLLHRCAVTEDGVIVNGDEGGTATSPLR
jgi:hypothetical protein